MPNYKHSYAFEAIYESCRDKHIEEFMLNDTITFVNSAVADINGRTKFYIYNNETGCSFADVSSSVQWVAPPPGWSGVDVDVIKLDDFCKENNIYPDLIKMDIEGGETAALKGGIEAIKKSRPQLAISIYHSDKDFVNIPVCLYDNLEDYVFKLGQYSPYSNETIMYAIPKELI